MAEHKAQHFIPRSYLAAWCDPDTPRGYEPYVWVFPKESGPGRRNAPRNIFTETDLYTIRTSDASRDLRLEHGLSELEGTFADSCRNTFEPRGALSESDHFKLAVFMAAMQARTLKQRDHWREQWQGIADQGERMMESIRRMTPRERKRLPQSIGSGSESLSFEEVKSLAANPVPSLLYTAISGMGPILYQMHLSIFCTTSEPGFITSDAPCVVFDPEAHKRPFPYNSSGLAFPTVEVTFPISPTRLAFVSHKELRPYIDVPDTIVHEVNRLTRGFAKDVFVVSRDQTRPGWYDLGALRSTPQAI
jgi:hypothetical protein